MPTTVQQIVNEAFFDLGAVASGAAPSISESNDGLLRLNQMLSSWSTEGATVFNQVMQLFALQNGVTAYQLGPGGSWGTAQRAQKVTAWRANFGDMAKGGAPLSMAEFGMAAAAVNQQLAELAVRAALEGLTSGVFVPLVAPIPTVVGADTNFPLINVRVAPTPSNAGAQIELAYWTPIAQFGALTDVVNLPQGFEDALHFGLAIRLAPQYARQTGVDPALAAMAQQTKAAIVQQNTTAQQQAPQTQQAA